MSLKATALEPALAHERVYIIDDDESLRKALSFVLKGLGCLPIPYAGAEHFLAHANPNEPGILLLDVKMGEMSGLALQERLIDTGVDWPIIFLSGHGELEMAVETMMKGAVCFLQKPVRREKLIEALKLAAARFTKKEASRQAAYDALSSREKQLVRLAAQGLSARLAAERLGIAQRTAEFHKASAMRKLGVHTVQELTEALEGVVL